MLVHVASSDQLGEFQRLRRSSLWKSLDGTAHGISNLFQRCVGGAKRGHGVKDGAQRPEQTPSFQAAVRKCPPTAAR